MREDGQGGFHGINIGRSGINISHLMFADDTILFYRACKNEVKAVWKCLQKYQEWSGQCVNVQKSGLIFSSNSSDYHQREIASWLGMVECERDIHYLDNPLYLGRNRGASFTKLKKKVYGRLEGWMAKTISRAGRGTLVKSVIQSIPVYAMATFRLPKYFCQSLDKVTRKFWRTGKNKEKGFLALTSWNNICQPKSQGGLGFRKFEDINTAMLCKLGWHMAAITRLLWVTILKDKYCGNKSFFQCELR